MADIAIVTDAGCDLTREQARALGIAIVPLVVRFGEDVDDDGSLDTEGFWRRVAASPPYPETSQPSPAAFEAAFAPLIDAGKQVVCPLISERLSGTFNAACLAAQRFAQRVHVFDTRSLSLGQALIVLRAAEHARRGTPLDRLLADLTDMRRRTRLVIMLETLDFLRRGGRASRLLPMVRRVTRVLRVRPLLRLVDGELRPLGVARSRRRAAQALLRGILAAGPIETLAIAHTRSPDEAGALADLAAEASGVQRDTVVVREAGPALASHAGPGVLALAAIGQGRA